MSQEFFKDLSKVEVRAYFIGQRINTKALEHTKRLARAPIVTNAGQEGCAVLFRYGVCVLFGMNSIEEAAFLNTLDEFIVKKLSKAVVEECTVILGKNKNEGVEPDNIIIQNWDVERIQLIAEALAKSAVLSYYETRIADTFDRIEPVASDLQSGGMPKGKNARELLKHIGYTLSIQRKMVGQVEIEEKPEILWDRPDLEKLYLRLEDEYEIPERHRSLRRKLDLIYKTAETMLSLLQEKRTLHVEWYIVILIIVEIFISMIEKLLSSHPI